MLSHRPGFLLLVSIVAEMGSRQSVPGGHHCITGQLFLTVSFL